MANKWIQLMSADGTDNLFPVGKMDLLWTNSAPTSAFSAQTVSIDLSGYLMVAVMFKQTASAPYNKIYEFIPDGTSYEVESMESPSLGCYRRRLTVSSTGIDFTIGYTNQNQGNTSMVPYKIYGIK